MKQIDSTRIQITENPASVTGFQITRMGEPIDEVESARLETETTLWDKGLSESADYTKLVGISPIKVDPTDPYFARDAISTVSIMKELIREHYLANAIVDTTEAFIYDYLDQDNTLFEGIDQGGNSIINVMDSNTFDNIDQIERYYP